MAPMLMFFDRPECSHRAHEPAESERAGDGEAEETQAAAAISRHHWAQSINMTTERA